jgi:hypothetical protein
VTRCESSEIDSIESISKSFVGYAWQVRVGIKVTGENNDEIYASVFSGNIPVGIIRQLGCVRGGVHVVVVVVVCAGRCGDSDLIPLKF